MPSWSGSALKKRGIPFVVAGNSNCRQSAESRNRPGSDLRSVGLGPVQSTPVRRPDPVRPAAGTNAPGRSAHPATGADPRPLPCACPRNSPASLRPKNSDSSFPPRTVILCGSRSVGLAPASVAERHPAAGESEIIPATVPDRWPERMPAPPLARLVPGAVCELL